MFSRSWQKRALGGFHGSSFPLLECRLRLGTLESTRRKTQTALSCGACRAMGDPCSVRGDCQLQHLQSWAGPERGALGCEGLWGL